MLYLLNEITLKDWIPNWFWYITIAVFARHFYRTHRDRRLV